MGQKQITVAGSALRRIGLALLVAALMAVMMSVSALPAMAKNSGPQPPGPPKTNENTQVKVFHFRGEACVIHDTGDVTGGDC